MTARPTGGAGRPEFELAAAAATPLAPPRSLSAILWHRFLEHRLALLSLFPAFAIFSRRHVGSARAGLFGGNHILAVEIGEYRLDILSGHRRHRILPCCDTRMNRTAYRALVSRAGASNAPSVQ